MLSTGGLDRGRLAGCDGVEGAGGLGARTRPPQLSRRRRGEPCRGRHRGGALEGTRQVWGPQKPAGTLGDKDLRDTTALKLLLTQTLPQEGVVTSGPSDVGSRVAPGKGTVLSVCPQAAPASPPGRFWGDSGPDTLELKAGSLGWGVRGGAASPPWSPPLLHPGIYVHGELPCPLPRPGQGVF